MKKNIRKLAALSLAACMALSASGALAEEVGNPQQQMPGMNGGWNQQTPPMMPGAQGGWNQQTPPAMGDRNGWGRQTPPQLPNGEQPTDGQTPPQMPDGQNSEQAPGSQNDQTRQMPRDFGGNAQNGQHRQDKTSHSSAPTDDSKTEEKTDNADSKPNAPTDDKADANSDSKASGESGKHAARQTPGESSGKHGQQTPGMNGEANRRGGGSQGNSQQSSEQTEDSESRQTPPDMPSGMQPTDGQTPPDMPGGMPGEGGFGGGSSAPTEYSAASVVTESSENESYASEADDENAVLVSGGEVTLSGATVSKTGSSDGESADFYGINAAVLASNGATLTIEDADVTSNGAHANGVFSYGEGTTVNVSGTTITTTGNNSGGLMTTGGATLNASNVTVSTAGNSSAAIRSDRGGGTVTVDGGSYETSGVGSPAIYSTADITVANATLAASSSEAVVIEGGNTVSLTDVAISGNDAVLNGQSTVNTNVLIYQSMSGDAADGNSSFTMTGGSMTAETGDMFHVTNVTTEITLSNVEFTTASDVFLTATADSWGKSGSNGGHVTLNLSEQTVTGDMVVDEVSSLSLNLNTGASYTGAINPTGAAGTVTVTLAEGAAWTLTADSYVTAFNGSLSQVNLNGYTLYVNGEAA